MLAYFPGIIVMACLRVSHFHIHLKQCFNKESRGALRYLEMETELLCTTSDAVNRYGFCIHITAMEKALKDVYDKGMPTLIGHDFHRPIGWTIPFGIFIEPSMGRMIAKKIVATNSKEQVWVNMAVQNFLNKRYHDNFSIYEHDFLQLIESSINSTHQKIDCGCVAVIQDGIAESIFEEIFKQKDVDGLIALDVLLEQFIYLKQGVFKHKYSALSVFAHSYMRRSQSRYNSFYFQFLDELMLLSSNKNVNVKICLDPDLIGYAPSFHAIGELEYHWGPKYTDDLQQMKVGLCRHVCNDFQRRYYGISSTEFYWKRDSDETTFEMEELCDTPSPTSDEIFHCRYIHSIYNTSRKAFIHFDGAMRSYDFEAMTDRVSKTFLEYGRKAMYKKMFRIDGSLPLDKWKLLVTHYYQGNPLIYEYFGLGEERELQKAQLRELSAFQKLLPYTITKEKGLRLFISYHEIPETLKQGRYIDLLDVMANEEKKTYCLEHGIHEVKIAIQRSGGDLEIPPDIDFIKMDDEYWNIPSIMHNSDNIPLLLQQTLDGLIMLFTAMNDKTYAKKISLTLSFPFNNRIVRISSFGEIANQLEWLKNSFPFVYSEEGITEWVNEQRNYLNQYEADAEDPLAASLIQYDGVLFIKRVPVPFPYKYSTDEEGQLKYSIQFPNEEDDIDGVFNLISQDQIRIIMAMAIESILWEDTKENYYTSSRSKWIDNEESMVIIDRCSPLALYWASPK